MKIKELYNYLFYTLYSFWETISFPKFWSDAKATFSIITLEVFTTISTLVYYKVFFNLNSDLLKQKWIYILIIVLIGSFNFYFFIFKDQYKQIIRKYDKWPKEKNEKWGIWVWTIVLIILVNFVFACYIFKKTYLSS